MSFNPKGLSPLGKLPTGAVVAQPSSDEYIAVQVSPWALAQATHSLPHAFKSRGPGASFPHGYVLPDVPRAPYSHSSSVGNRLLAHRQYALAWFQSTQLIGCLPCPLLPQLHAFAHHSPEP
jgi:hypothetical protein